MTPDRRVTRQIRVGDVAVGGDAPVTVQTMTKTDTRDVEATVRQILEVEEAGCDMVRLAVVDEDAARAVGRIRKAVNLPLIADIHFDHRLALTCLAAGVDGLRLNPGNIGTRAKVAEVVQAARERSVPIRIGVNSGSLEKDVAEKHGGSTPGALVESALRHAAVLEAMDYHEIKLSAKATDVWRTVETYRLLAAKCDYPLHLGVTEAGTFMAGTVRSSVALGILLAEGIGDTIRISLTDTPAREVRVGLELLRCLGLRDPGPSIISCPTCGRIEVDVVGLAEGVETELSRLHAQHLGRPFPSVALMGCMVNGPGEARQADLALAGGRGKFALYREGRLLRTVPESDAVPALMEEVRRWLEPG